MKRTWTTAELRVLREYAGEGVEALAIRLDRSVSSVKHAAERNRISLRRTGEARGAILGQPRGESFASYRNGHPLSDLRLEALEGRIDLAELEEQVRKIATSKSNRNLCPSCVAREATTRTGLCRVCHMRALASAMTEERDYREAARSYEAARQRRHRERSK